MEMTKSLAGYLYRPAVAALGAYALAGLFAPTQAMADAAAGPAAGAPIQVEEVVVTSRRRNETVQSTPLSVTAISPSQLKAAGAPDIRDLAGRAPDLVIDPVNAGPSAAAISIRGISFEDIEKSFDPAVGVLIDDVYIGTNTGQLTDTFDLQAVEVLRGPQGTLFGRNTIGGVVRIQRTRPTGQLGGDFDLVYGDYGRLEGHAVLNLPKVADQLSTKLFFSSREVDGFYHNVTLNKDTPKTDVKRFGATFLWQPNAKLDANLTIEHAIERSQTDQAPLSSAAFGDSICLPLQLFGFTGYQPAPAAECSRTINGKDLYTTYSNKLGVANNDEDDITLQVGYDLGNDLKLTSVTAYRRNKEHVTQDFDSTSINFFDTVRDQTYDQFSQELRLSGKYGKTVDYVLGAYYFDSSYDLHQLTNYGVDLGVLILSAPISFQGQQFAHHESKSYAAFGDVNWAFMDRWRLTVGGRYTSDEKSLNNHYAGSFTSHASKSWSEFTPKASIDYKPTDESLLYASYSRGFRSGGYNGRSATLTSSTTPYNPETVDAYEIGAKTEWFDRRLTVNVAYFDTEYQNKQEEVVSKTPPGSPNPQETLVSNAASAKIKGAELDLQARPTAALTLRGTLGVIDAKYDNFKAQDATYGASLGLVDDLSGLTLRRAPRATGGAGFDYKVELPFGRVTWTTDYRYLAAHETSISRAPGTGIWTCPPGAVTSAGCTFAKAVNDPRAHAVATNIIDMSISIDHDVPAGGQLRLTAFVRNLTDERGLAGALPVAGLFTFGTGRPPKTVGVQIGYRF